MPKNMTNYQFQGAIEKTFLFPKELELNPNVIFHGTIEYHSNSIEEDGFVVGNSPFDIEAANLLIDTLRLPEFAPFDTPNPYGSNTATGLEGFLAGLDNGYRLSFGPLGSKCAMYTCGALKGGQATHYIREANSKLNTSFARNAELANLIPKEVTNLFDCIALWENSCSVIYAVKLGSLRGVDVEGHIHIRRNIVPDEIVGKMIIPNDFPFDDFDENKMDQIIRSKLHLNGGLGIQVERYKD